MSSEDLKQEQKNASARDLRNIGTELASLAAGLSRALKNDWARATTVETPDPKVMDESTAVCIRYGQRLGELNLSTERAEALTDSEVDSLYESSVRDCHGRLARLGSRAAFLLSTQLPALMERRKLLAERLTDVSSRLLRVRGDRPFRWHTFLFYLLPAVLVLGAEGALAEDITRTAFRLKGFLWFLFPVALLSLPLVFKELFEWSRLDRFQKGYVIVILVLIFLLLFPLAWIRSSQVFRGEGRPARTVNDPFAAPGNPAGQRPADVAQRQMTESRLFLLTFVFGLFGALFPMVSGLCFYRAWDMAEKGLEGWRIRKEGEREGAEMAVVDTGSGACRAELDSIQHETVRLIASLGPGDRFVEKMIADLVGSLRGTGPEVVESIKQKIAIWRDDGGGWPELAKRLALEVEALEHPGGALDQARVKFQKDLLSSIAQVEEGDSLRSQAETLKRRARAALAEGHQVGTETPFAMLAAESPEQMVHLFRQRKIRDALFRGRRRPAPAAAPTS